MNFRVIVTVGPSSLNEKSLKNIDAYGDCIYRLNGAHLDGEQTRHYAEILRSIIPNAVLMVDLPGNKIRTANLPVPILLKKGDIFKIREYELNYPQFYKHLKVGNHILANDSNYTFEVVSIEGTTISIKSLVDGKLETNKGLHVRGIHNDIPFLFDRDKELIKVACSEKLNIVSLSYVRTKADVMEAKSVIVGQGGKEIEIFSKIETASAIENLTSILEATENINVDRGDLSFDIGMLNIPQNQEYIINTAKKFGKNVFLATQFLKNMETNPVPLISEMTSLYQAVKDNVAGIQLSEETAIGKYPEECVKMVFEVLENLRK